MPYEILQLDINGQWSSSESFRKGEGSEDPELFDTPELAKTALDEFLTDCNEAVEMGNMVDAPSADEFSIVPSLGLEFNHQDKPEYSHDARARDSGMSLVKTKYLTGDALTYAVMALLDARVHIGEVAHMVKLTDKPWLYFSDVDVSKEWSITGPLKNSNRISSNTDHTGFWFAYTTDMNDEKQHMHVGHNELEVIARTFIELKIGAQLLIPSMLAADSLALQNPPKRGQRP